MSSGIERPVTNPIVVLREEFDDWAVIFNPDTAEAAGINPVGVAIWKLLDGKHTVDEVAAEIGERFEGVPQSAPGEIAAFVKSLEEKGFVGRQEEMSPK